MEQPSPPLLPWPASTDTHWCTAKAWESTATVRGHHPRRPSLFFLCTLLTCEQTVAMVVVRSERLSAEIKATCPIGRAAFVEPSIVGLPHTMRCWPDNGIEFWELDCETLQVSCPPFSLSLYRCSSSHDLLFAAYHYGLSIVMCSHARTICFSCSRHVPSPFQLDHCRCFGATSPRPSRAIVRTWHRTTECPHPCMFHRGKVSGDLRSWVHNT